MKTYHSRDSPHPPQSETGDRLAVMRRLIRTGNQGTINTGGKAMNAHDRMYQRIEKHGNDLKAVFHLPEADPVKLAKRLHTLETQANHAMTQYANGDIDMEELDKYEDEKLIPAVLRIIGKDNADKLKINRDPRGYTLKLTEEATKQAQDAGINIHRDWGGYGILAPEFDGKE